MNLFQNGDFILSSKTKSTWKIDCDALSEDDWLTLSIMAHNIIGNFSLAIGVPVGGCHFAKKLNNFCTHEGSILICEDVLTTGESMERIKYQLCKSVPESKVKGITVFARGTPPLWVKTIFQFTGS